MLRFTILVLVLLVCFVSAQERGTSCGGKLVRHEESTISQTRYIISYSSADCEQEKENKLADAQFRKPAARNDHHAITMIVTLTGNYENQYTITVVKDGEVIAQRNKGNVSYNREYNIIFTLLVDVKRCQPPFDIYLTDNVVGERVLHYIVEPDIKQGDATNTYAKSATKDTSGAPHKSQDLGNQEEQVIIVYEQKLYHKDGCPKLPKRVPAITSRTSAESGSYKACKVCYPPAQNKGKQK